MYDALKKDPRCKVTVVYARFTNTYDRGSENELPQYQRAYCSDIKTINNYNPLKNPPDVAIFVKPYDEFIPLQTRFRYIEHITKYTVYIPYGMEFNTDIIKYAFNGYLHAKVWRHIGYGPLVKDYGKYYGFCNGKNIVSWGHPKGDYVCEKIDLPADWIEKISGRKVILWTPHHTIDENDPHHLGTWKKWNKVIFELFSEKKELVLLIRPHPLLFTALKVNNELTEEQIEGLKKQIEKSDNIILDEYQDYRFAIGISDALITDGTTFSLEYLYTNKPEAVTFTNKDSFYNHDEFEKSVCMIGERQDLISFINAIQNGEDPNRDNRVEFSTKYLVKPVEGTIGANIVNHLIGDMLNDLMDPYQDYHIE